MEQHENTREGALLDDISRYAVDDEGDQLLFKLDTSGEEICTIGWTDGKLRLKIRPDREVCNEKNVVVVVFQIIYMISLFLARIKCINRSIKNPFFQDVIVIILVWS